ncbi:type II toxin-antitoxin system TacA family antitoxin [Aquimarina mytili]|uniref:DUF1778 domain-containing protein n=1 Tax=Aquimarina mytili TaxID=874423 RepID=A0A937DBH6_9FLAO|nr:DUF1778 domain-containing protein [Aquimarina mytili]MBL0684628.1 DUF1778 domain-containing protein [Aquimarina mytili]
MKVTKKLDKTRFDTRLSIKQKELFERAATLGGYGSLTDFVLKTVQKRAKEIIKENEVILASKRDSEIFFDALMNPEPPNEALKNAAKKYLKVKE